MKLKRQKDDGKVKCSYCKKRFKEKANTVYHPAHGYFCDKCACELERYNVDWQNDA